MVPNLEVPLLGLGGSKSPPQYCFYTNSVERLGDFPLGPWALDYSKSMGLGMPLLFSRHIWSPEAQEMPLVAGMALVLISWFPNYHVAYLPWFPNYQWQPTNLSAGQSKRAPFVRPHTSHNCLAFCLNLLSIFIGQWLKLDACNFNI